MHPFFDKVIAAIKVEKAFQDYPEIAADGASKDIRRPRYEGDFATSTDASKLFEEGVNVPQEALNLTRISTTKALEKAMPDWAVQEWLTDFLKRPDLPHLAEAVLEKYKNGLVLIPSSGRGRKKFFDYRVDRGGSGIDRRNAVFTQAEAKAGVRILVQKPFIAMGVLFWQFALQNYAHELAEYALISDVEELLKTRLVAYARFLSTSAFMLGSFGALLPLAIVTYEKTEATNDAATAVGEFSSRGGFMKHEVPKLFPYIFGGMLKSASDFKPAWFFKPRVIICSAKEAIPRWAMLPIDGQGSLSAYIAAVKNVSKQSAEWKKVLEKAAAIIAAGGNEGKAAACPFHGRRGAA